MTSAPADATVTPITPSRTAAPTNTPFLRTVPVPADTTIPATTLPVGTPSITITVTMNDMRFQPSELTVRSGETVHLELQNPDRLEHAFVIADANVAVVLSPMSEQEVDFVVNLPPGTYYIHCPILDEGGDHEVNGMTGKLIVEAAP
ncbi:MAG TPA: cupredoxin domain-containing protein [Anaerolineales bacterium]|nr:cupredoxin domain-containing protein [Anaerolineales bacterium]